MLMMTFSFIILDPSPVMTGSNTSYQVSTPHTWPQVVMPGSDRASLLLQRLGRIGAGGTEGLPEDGGEGDREG